MLGDYQTEVLDRAYEIAFAVFRVATLIRHLKLKAELEEAAIKLVSQCGDIPYFTIQPTKGKSSLSALY